MRSELLSYAQLTGEEIGKERTTCPRRNQIQISATWLQSLQAPVSSNVLSAVFPLSLPRPLVQTHSLFLNTASNLYKHVLSHLPVSIIVIGLHICFFH